ncbi:MAG: DUF349 domain-containing protein [Gallionella sp.]
MLSKIFKKKQAAAEVVAPPKQPMPLESWNVRLGAAQGNDAELLRLAIDAPSIDTRLAAVNSIASEEVLRAAEHEFRKRDRRVHSLAKQRYKLQVDTRLTRIQAAELIQTAAELMCHPVIAANRLAELSAAWGHLPQELIEDQDLARFAQLQIELAAMLRERGEQKRAATRWSETASQLLAELKSVCAEAANDSAGTDDFASRLASVRERCNIALSALPTMNTTTKPDDDANSELDVAMKTALRESEFIESRVALIAELQSTQSPPLQAISGEVSAPAAADVPLAAKQRWQDMPKLSDKRIGGVLNGRFEELMRVLETARNQRHKSIVDIARKEDKFAKQAHILSLIAQADTLESELASGHLSEAAKLLVDLQKASEPGFTSAAMQTRIGALQAEISRLKGWQHWGGGRVREDLVQEAEALSASTMVAEGAVPGKMPIRQLEHDITQLRDRWKELDRLGGATSKSLWERFDTALKLAYLPVATHLAQLKASRQENLEARNKLLAELDALQIATRPGDSADWKTVARSLAHFQTEWRKLGPVEHTVPRKSQAALLERFKASVARLEVPLQEEQGDAQSLREMLIVKAKALIKDAHGRNTMATLRELQDQWQAQAKTLPLPRKAENTLWTEFRTAIDELMTQRTAAISARDAEFKANQDTREALIRQLEEIHQDTPPTDIRRVMANVEKEWRSTGEAPRKSGSALESRYRAAREQALRHIEGAATRSWQLRCDSLRAKLTLCEACESGAAQNADKQWEDFPALPLAWEQPLHSRFNRAGQQAADAKQSGSGAQLDLLLLRLETALALPSPGEFESARHALKLQAMKKALEGHTSATPSWQEIEKIVADVLAITADKMDQRKRLYVIVDALRSVDPGAYSA